MEKVLLPEANCFSSELFLQHSDAMLIIMCSPGALVKFHFAPIKYYWKIFVSVGLTYTNLRVIFSDHISTVMSILSISCIESESLFWSNWSNGFAKRSAIVYDSV